ncbi:MAG: PhnD/SsuA/transferrin family substrate-binding protein, partial [Chloroflexota bacterium]
MKFRLLLFSLVVSLILAACNLPGGDAPASSAGTETATPEGGPLGTEENPIVMAIRPGSTREAGESAARVAGRLSSFVGLVVVAREAKSYTEIVEGMGAGEVHVAWLPPLAYLLARENGDADAALATIVDGRDLSATQFLVSAARLAGEGGFKTYFDPASGENVVEPSVALAQFEGKRP